MKIRKVNNSAEKNMNNDLFNNLELNIYLDVLFDK